MIEGNNLHGRGLTGYYTKIQQKKWIVGYRSKWGGYGEVGYMPLFNTRKEAEEFGKQFKADNSFVAEIIIKHPAAMYSTY